MKPSDLKEKILSDFNIDLTDNAITMFFKRNNGLRQQLEKEIVEEEKQYKEVKDTIFENGTFEQIESVKRWVTMQNTNVVSQSVIRSRLNLLKWLCRGKIAKTGEEVTIPKHPDRLTIEDCQDYIAKIREKGAITTHYRLASRSFLQSKGIMVQRTSISGDKGKIGQFAELYTPRPQIEEIFAYLKERNYIAYLSSKFMFKTATRLGATLEATKGDMWKEEDTIYVRVLDKGRHSLGRKTWNKIVDKELWGEILASNPQDKLFPIKEHELNALLREAYKKVIPEIEPKIPMPSHYWRHQFAQHMLRLTKWNYEVVAQLGGWEDTDTLKQCYGMPPKEVIRKWGVEYVL